MYGTLYPSQNGPGVAPAGLGVASRGPSESLRILCAEHICNSGRRYEYRQKFLGDDECLVQKKKFFVDILVYTCTPLFAPDNFSSFESASENEAAGVTI